MASDVQDKLVLSDELISEDEIFDFNKFDDSESEEEVEANQEPPQKAHPDDKEEVAIALFLFWRKNKTTEEARYPMECSESANVKGRGFLTCCLTPFSIQRLSNFRITKTSWNYIWTFIIIYVI